MPCFYHNDRPSTVTCSRCGKTLCSECGSYLQPPTCVDCARAETAEIKGEMTKSVVISVILMIVGIVAMQNPLGILLAGIPSGWRVLNKITPAMFLWMPLVGWIIYFAIKLVLAYCIGLIALPIQLFRDIKALTDAKKLEEYINGVSR